MGFNERRAEPPADALRPIIPDNARVTRLTAAAGTSLADPYSCLNVKPKSSSDRKAVYAPKGVILHAVSLRQPCGHCGRFSTAASRRSQGSVSVPVRRVVLSHPLLIVALVGLYPTNKLISRRLILERKIFTPTRGRSTWGISLDFSRLCPTLG